MDCPLIRKAVTVRVPATSANLGSGYDCMGLALDLWNELTVEVADEFSITTIGEGSADLPSSCDNLVVLGLEAAFKHAGAAPVPPLKYTCVNAIPFARGLGSSSAAIVSGIIAGFALLGYKPQTRLQDELLNIAANIEGHPDNVAPCIYGGLQVGLLTESSGWKCVALPVSPSLGLQAVVFIPATTLETKKARGILPAQVPREDAIFNIGRSAALVAALASGRTEMIYECMRDKMHQPQRATIIPHLNPLIDAAMKSGAISSCLSGAGPSVLALSNGLSLDSQIQSELETQGKKIAEALVEKARELNLPGSAIVCKVVQQGAYIVEPVQRLSV